MMKLWKVACIAVVAAGMAAPAQAGVNGNDDDGIFCLLFGAFLPDCDDDTPDNGVTQADLDALEVELRADYDAKFAAQNATNAAQGSAIANLQSQNATQDGQIAGLQAQIDALENGISNLLSCEDLRNINGGANQTIIGECDGECTFLFSNEHCGACDNACEPDEDCNGFGPAFQPICEPKTCLAPPGDPNFDCSSAVVANDGTCVYTSVPDGTGCDDSNPCTATTTCSSGTCVSDGSTPCGPGTTCHIDSDSPDGPGYDCQP